MKSQWSEIKPDISEVEEVSISEVCIGSIAGRDDEPRLASVLGGRF